MAVLAQAPLLEVLQPLGIDHDRGTPLAVLQLEQVHVAHALALVILLAGGSRRFFMAAVLLAIPGLHPRAEPINLLGQELANLADVLQRQLLQVLEEELLSAGLPVRRIQPLTHKLGHRK